MLYPSNPLVEFFCWDVLESFVYSLCPTYIDAQNAKIIHYFVLCHDCIICV